MYIELDKWHTHCRHFPSIVIDLMSMLMIALWLLILLIVLMKSSHKSQTRLQVISINWRLGYFEIVDCGSLIGFQLSSFRD